jgi:hypothetical protein
MRFFFSSPLELQRHVTLNSQHGNNQQSFFLHTHILTASFVFQHKLIAAGEVSQLLVIDLRLCVLTNHILQPSGFDGCATPRSDDGDDGKALTELVSSA